MMVEMRTQFCCHRLKYECRDIVGYPQKLRDYDLRYIVSPRLCSYCSLFLKHQINCCFGIPTAAVLLQIRVRRYESRDVPVLSQR